MSDPSLRKVEGLILTTLIVSLGLIWVIARLRRRRPGLNIWKPVTVAVFVRMLAMAAVNATGAGSQLRGGDEDLAPHGSHRPPVRGVGGAYRGGDAQLRRMVSGQRLGPADPARGPPQAGSANARDAGRLRRCGDRLPRHPDAAECHLQTES